jgi:hypothetical protein
VHVAIRRGHPLRVEHPGELARIGKPDARRRTGRIREKSAAKQALKIEDQIKGLRAEFTQKPGKFDGDPKVPAQQPVPLAIEQDDLIQCGMPLQQPGATVGDEPADVRLREPPSQSVEHR